MKKVAIIAFLDVPEWGQNAVIDIIGDGKSYIITDIIELIDGDLIETGFGGEVGGESYKTYKVMDSTPDLETVQECLERMPNPFHDPSLHEGPGDYHVKMIS